MQTYKERCSFCIFALSAVMAGIVKLMKCKWYLQKHTFCTWLVRLAWAKDGAKSPTDHWKYSSCGLRQRRTEQGQPYWHKPNVKKCNNAYCKQKCIFALLAGTAGNAKLQSLHQHAHATINISFKFVRSSFYINCIYKDTHFALGWCGWHGQRMGQSRPQIIEYSSCGLRHRRTEQGKPHWHKPNVKKCDNAYCKRKCIFALLAGTAGNAKLQSLHQHAHATI